MGRRHLTPEAKSDLRGQRYNLEKKAHGGYRRSSGSSPDNQDLKTAGRLAQQYQVSADTIEKDGNVSVTERAKATDHSRVGFSDGSR